MPEAKIDYQSPELEIVGDCVLYPFCGQQLHSYHILSA